MSGFCGYFYDFSVDFDAIAVGDILDNKYSMKKQDINKMFGFIKKIFCTAMTFFGPNV